MTRNLHARMRGIGTFSSYQLQYCGQNQVFLRMLILFMFYQTQCCYNIQTYVKNKLIEARTPMYLNQNILISKLNPYCLIWNSNPAPRPVDEGEQLQYNQNVIQILFEPRWAWELIEHAFEGVGIIFCVTKVPHPYTSLLTSCR